LMTSSGILARAFENWKLGGIWTLSSGPWTNISAANGLNQGLYGNTVPDIANPDLLKELLGDADVRWGTQAGSFLGGRFFGPTKWTEVPVLRGSGVTPLQNLNGLQTGTTARCTMTALAKIVPAGTAGSIPLNDGSGNNGIIVLQNPQPGTRGNLGQNVLRGLSTWRF